MFICFIAFVFILFGFYCEQKELFKSAMEVDDDAEKPDEVTSPTDPSVSASGLKRLY